MPARESSPPTKGEVHVTREVHLKDLPGFSPLSDEVSKVVKSTSWWERHGIDWAHIVVCILACPLALLILRHDSLMAQCAGIVILGSYHSILANKSGHIASHGGLCGSKAINKAWLKFSVEFVGSFSSRVAEDIHIKVHHPHTNIIGLGDSSTWKAPFLTRVPYLFLTPLLVPFLTPLVSVKQLVEDARLSALGSFLAVMWAGVALHLYLLITYSGYSLLGAIVVYCVYRSLFAIPYIHVNIFQHIGLPMYSQENRPVRVYQMSTGCLNLYRNPILDHVFGHSLINCHVEHHLFPRLSDEMCLKVKPIVRRFLKENSLPYQEESYMNRLSLFYNEYESLMVNAPPITHFVGIQ